MSEETGEKKIEEKVIVDEDWKSQVEAEREAARQKAAAGQPAGEGQAAAAEQAGADKRRPEAEADPALPPPDLMFVATTFYMQALVALGVVPDPITRKPRLRPNQARHAIDSLEVLLEKTQGNRSGEESEAMDTMLHELRMAYVSVVQSGGKQ